MSHSSFAASVALFSALVWAPLATCQTESITGGSSMSIWGIPDSVYREHISHPNATGTNNFTLQTTTVDPIQMLGFSIQLNITADIPLANATTGPAEDEPDLFGTASILSLNGPVTDIAPNTTICFSVWSGLAANITAAAISTPKSGTGSAVGCENILSDECIGDLLDAADDFGMDCSGAPSIPETCSSQMAANYGGISSTLVYNSTDPVFYIMGSTPYAEKGNQTSWTETSTNIWPVLMTFVSNISVDDGATVSPTGYQTQYQLSCIKADTFSEGTTNPKDAASSGASTGSTPTGTAPAATSTPSNSATKSIQVSMTGLLAILALGFAFFG